MNKKKMAIFLLVAVLVALFFWLDLGRYLTLEGLRKHRETLHDFYVGHRLTTTVLYMLLYIVQTALALPGALVFALAAGLIFGTVLGTLYAVAAATTGAVLSFLVARYLFRDAVQKRWGGKLARLNATMETEGLNYLLFLRLVPIFPFFLINLGTALTPLNLYTFFFGTLLGIAPGAFVFVNAGASLGAINSAADIASPRVLGALALVGTFAIVPVVVRKLGRCETPSHPGL